VNVKIPLSPPSSAGRRVGVLLLVALGWSVPHAQAGVDPAIRLGAGCGPLTQTQQPQISYAAKPGDVVNAQIPVKDLTGTVPYPANVFWSLGTGSGCSGNLQSIQCGPAVFNVLAPAGEVDPQNLAGQVQITSAAIGAGDVGKTGIFTATVAEAPDGDPTCTWNYLLRVTSSGGGWGDPHMTTVDGVHYDFQSAGEFTALREDRFEVQTRQRPVSTTTVPGPSEYTGLGVCVSIYSAVAVRIGSNRISLEPNLSGEPDPSGLQLRVNGKLVTLSDSGIDLRAGGGSDPAAPLEGRITKASGGAYEFTDAGGTQLVATPAYWDSQQTWYLNLSIYQTSATQGIWGRLADESWLPALPDGTSLGDKPTPLDQRYQNLYVKFADAWRVTDATSLFDYAPGTSTATFTVADWPRFNAESCLIEGQTPAEPTTPEIAAQACSGITDPAQKADCTFDVTVTGNTGFAKTYVTMQEFEPHGTGWQPALGGAGQPTPTPTPPPPPTRHWPWWWILILILVLIVIIVLIARKKKTA
jgi:hypothetical protein